MRPQDPAAPHWQQVVSRRLLLTGRRSLALEVFGVRVGLLLPGLDGGRRAWCCSKPATALSKKKMAAAASPPPQVLGQLLTFEP
jgi:hypothetical protein